MEQKEKEKKSTTKKWYYRDPSGQEQGPFDTQQMAQWFNDGYFPKDLPIRYDQKIPFVQLNDWFLQGMTAFLEHIPSQWPQTNEDIIYHSEQRMVSIHPRPENINNLNDEQNEQQNDEEAMDYFINNES